MYTIYSQHVARVMKNNIIEQSLVSLLCIYKNHLECMPIAKVFVSYEIYVMYSIITILNIGIIHNSYNVPASTEWHRHVGHIFGANLTLLKLFSLGFHV